MDDEFMGAVHKGKSSYKAVDKLDVFGRSHFMKVYGFGWMWGSLIYLRNHETLESIYGRFDDFKEILSENWIFER